MLPAGVVRCIKERQDIEQRMVLVHSKRATVAWLATRSVEMENEEDGRLPCKPSAR